MAAAGLAGPTPSPPSPVRTWPIKKVALAHVCNVQPLEQQDGAAKVSLHEVGGGDSRQPLLIAGLRIEAQAGPCGVGQSLEKTWEAPSGLCPSSHHPGPATHLEECQRP